MSGAAKEMQAAVLVPFSTPIFRVQMPGAEALNEQLAEYILGREKLEESKPRSRRGGWQSGLDAHRWELPAMQEICRAAVGAVTDVLSKAYAPACPISVAIDECWANVNYAGAYHVPHNHPYPWVASYYVRTRAGERHLGAISFINPVPVARNIWQRQQFRLEPEAGEFVIFPGCYMHYVEPNLSEEPRIGFAFNFDVRTASSPWLGR